MSSSIDPNHLKSPVGDPSRVEFPSRLPVPERREPELIDPVANAIERAREFLFSVQREEAQWCAELESNTTITAEYVFMCQMIGMRRELEERAERLSRYLLGQQKEDGSWSIADCWEGDVSTTAEAYLALRILGVPADHPGLLRAEHYIRGNGGLERMRIFTRIFFAMFGLLPWDCIPAIPPEVIFLPPKSPVNIYSLFELARGTMVPLFIISHFRPVYALPNGKSLENGWLDHLWLDPSKKNLPYCSSWLQLAWRHGASWRTLFGAADWALKMYEKVPIGPVRRMALERCADWVLERQEESGDWAGIFPPMLNGVIALTLQGYGLDSEPVKKGIEAIHRFSWEDGRGLRIQACVSPVWDTALSMIGLIDSNADPADPRLVRAARWVLDRQLLVDHGDWKVYRPELQSGGWSFEYHNSWYPDIDDTAAVVLALLKQAPSSVASEAVARAARWMLGMQNRDGGWGAFDVDNDKSFLNEIPFSDMDSLCDPSSPDVTGRVIEAFGLMLECLPLDRRFPQDLEQEIRAASRRAVEYLRHAQEEQGSWFGRWGVNYVYGTSNALCGLARLRIPASDPMIAQSLDWLKRVQNADGGWGESLASYADKRWMGRGESTPSQTAWALMGLLGYLSPEDASIRKGALWLIRHQKRAEPVTAFEGGMPLPPARGSTWEEKPFTGTGFPKHFYLRYNLYRHYFPMMALGRYLRAQEN